MKISLHELKHIIRRTITEMDCRRCHGSGRIPCSKCDGEGCDYCDEYNGTIDCPECGGEDTNPDEDDEHDSFQPEPVTRCPRCRGKKIVLAPDAPKQYAKMDLSSVPHYYQEICSLCDGTGFVP